MIAKEYIFAFLISCGLCSFALVLMASVHENEEFEEEKPMTVREVVQVPPPPPPKEIIKRIKTKPIQITVLQSEASQSSVILKTKELNVDYSMSIEPTVSLNSDPSFDFEVDVEVQEALQTEFTFDSLDEKPRMIHKGGFSYIYPNDLYRRGVKQGRVVLMVEINPKGKAKVLGVQSSSHRQFVPIAKRMVRMATFNAPTVNGEPVTVPGSLPITINAPKRK